MRAGLALAATTLVRRAGRCRVGRSVSAIGFGDMAGRMSSNLSWSPVQLQDHVDAVGHHQRLDPAAQAAERERDHRRPQPLPM
jgi:hypothetical protein